MGDTRAAPRPSEAGRGRGPAALRARVLDASRTLKYTDPAPDDDPGPWLAARWQLEVKFVTGPNQRSEGMRIARNSALLAIGDGIGLAFGFFSTLLVTDRLGADYGLLVGAQRFVGPFIVIVQFGLYPLLVRAFASGRGDPGALFATALLVRVVLGVVFAVTVPVAASLTGYMPGQRWLLLTFVGVELLGVFADTFMARCEGFEAFGRSAVISIARSATTFAGVVAVAFHGGGVVAFASVYLVSRSIQIAVAAVVVRHAGPHLALRIDFASVRPLVREALWFVGAGLASTLQGTIAVMMLTRFSTSAETARFGASLNFLEVTMVLPVLLQRSLLPAFSRLSGTGGAAGIAHNALRLIPAVLIPAGVGMSCLAASIMALYPSGKFTAAAPVLRLIALWLICVGPLNVCGALLTGLGRLRALIGVNLFGTGIQAMILWFAIPRAGAVGAAASTLIAYALSAAVLLHLVRGSGVALPWPALARVALASLVMAAVLVPMQHAPLALAVVAGAAVYAITWWLLLPRDSLERRLFASSLEEFRRRRQRR